VEEMGIGEITNYKSMALIKPMNIMLISAGWVTGVA
jgi:hypothetical protein